MLLTSRALTTRLLYIVSEMLVQRNNFLLEQNWSTCIAGIPAKLVDTYAPIAIDTTDRRQLPPAELKLGLQASSH